MNRPGRGAGRSDRRCRPRVRSQRSNPARQQRILAIVLAAVVLLLLLVAGSAILRAERLAQQVAATGQSLMQSQRLAKSVSQALVGNVAGFRRSEGQLGRPDAARARPDERRRCAQARARGQPVRRRTRARSRRWSSAPTRAPRPCWRQQQILTQVGTALRDINRQSSDLLEMTETVASLKMQQNATPARDLRRRPAGDADAAHRQVGQRIPDGRRREPRRRVPARQGPEHLPGNHARPARRQRPAAPARLARSADAPAARSAS